MGDQAWIAVKRQTTAQHGDLVGAIEDRTLRGTDDSPAMRATTAYCGLRRSSAGFAGATVDRLGGEGARCGEIGGAAFTRLCTGARDISMGDVVGVARAARATGSPDPPATAPSAGSRGRAPWRS